MLRLLILGGTAEARALAERAAARPGLAVTTSLAGRTAAPRLPAGDVRSGGFGGADGLARYLAENRIELLVDATHPFAAQISRHAAAACARTGTPRLMLVRAPWTARPGDRWIEVIDAGQAAARLPALARRALLAIGGSQIGAFAGADQPWFLVRLVDPPAKPLPLAACTVIAGRGPFGIDAEVDLMRRHRVEAVVAKNSGGTAAYGKIAAARALALPVLMIGRPALPQGECAATVDEAWRWVEMRLA